MNSTMSLNIRWMKYSNIVLKAVHSTLKKFKMCYFQFKIFLFWFS